MYRIIFQGQISDGSDMDAVKTALATLFRIDQGAQLARLFSGAPITIKKQLDEQAARKYLAAIERTGARVIVEPPLPTPQQNLADDFSRELSDELADAQSSHDPEQAAPSAEPDPLSFQTVMQSFRDEPLADSPTAGNTRADHADSPDTTNQFSATDRVASTSPSSINHTATEQPSRRRWLPLLLGAAAALLVSLLLISHFGSPSQTLPAKQQAQLQTLFAIAADGSDAEYAEALATVEDADTRQAMADLRAMVDEVREEYNQ